MKRSYKESDIIKIRGRQYKVRVWQGEHAYLRCGICAMRKKFGHCNLRHNYEFFLADCNHALPIRYYFTHYDKTTS